MRRALLLALALPLLAGGGPSEANRPYRAGDHAGAAAAYSRLYQAGDSSAALRYNLGTALLRGGQWDEARGHLEAAFAVDSPPALRQRAWYNAGNSDLEPVFRKQVSEPQAREERLRRAIERYKLALLARPGDADAKWNLELAQRLLNPTPPQGGGGGGAGNEGGGGDQGQPQPTPQPAPSPRQQPVPNVSQQEAERILTGAERSEQEAQRQMLSRNRGERQAVRDW
jgi:Ca-activated chloride channel family protein